jgi:protein-disulfide isomerase
MSYNHSKTAPITGIISLTSVFVVLVAAMIGYMAYKVQTLETKLKETETKAAAAAANPGGAAQPTLPPVDMSKVKGLFRPENIAFGDANRKILFVEFADPSCQFCHIAAGKNEEFTSSGQFQTVEKGGSYVPPVPEIRKLVEAGKASYVLVYASGRGNGELAAAALYCADERGDFWAVHDLLYTSKGYELINNEVKNDKTKAAKLASFLASVTNKSAMQQCLSSGKYERKLAQDMQLAQAMGYGGTPTYFVNDQRFPGAYSFTEMEEAIRKLL